ncbi:hypothetical protein D9611_011144 [Ephemerocybe angulata]|uniref:Uncharacterized protein n=1 Tax=Ephemerocybe angulata TaxID=980116 RepID=A0A8H5FJK2_9AGAR|nr:hypothetical protein D9611_011144 [Tulosesus angulatus]
MGSKPQDSSQVLASTQSSISVEFPAEIIAEIMSYIRASAQEATSLRGQGLQVAFTCKELYDEFLPIIRNIHVRVLSGVNGLLGIRGARFSYWGSVSQVIMVDRFFQDPLWRSDALARRLIKFFRAPYHLAPGEHYIPGQELPPDTEPRQLTITFTVRSLKDTDVMWCICTLLSQRLDQSLLGQVTLDFNVDEEWPRWGATDKAAWGRAVLRLLNVCGELEHVDLDLGGGNIGPLRKPSWAPGDQLSLQRRRYLGGTARVLKGFFESYLVAPNLEALIIDARHDAKFSDTMALLHLVPGRLSSLQRLTVRVTYAGDLHDTLRSICSNKFVYTIFPVRAGTIPSLNITSIHLVATSKSTGFMQSQSVAPKKYVDPAAVASFLAAFPLLENVVLDGLFFCLQGVNPQQFWLDIKRIWTTSKGLERLEIRGIGEMWETQGVPAVWNKGDKEPTPGFDFYSGCFHSRNVHRVDDSIREYKWFSELQVTFLAFLFICVVAKSLIRDRIVDMFLFIGVVAFLYRDRIVYYTRL